jgi:hypothetical protein
MKVGARRLEIRVCRRSASFVISLATIGCAAAATGGLHRTRIGPAKSFLCEPLRESSFLRVEVFLHVVVNKTRARGASREGFRLLSCARARESGDPVDFAEVSALST